MLLGRKSRRVLFSREGSCLVRLSNCKWIWENWCFLTLLLIWRYKFFVISSFVVIETSLRYLDLMLCADWQNKFISRTFHIPSGKKIIFEYFCVLLLQEKKRNNLKDYLNVAGPMGVTHFLMLSKTETAPYLRVARTPQGPTLTFKIQEYSLAVDIAQSQLRPRCPKDLFKNPPLVIVSLVFVLSRYLYSSMQK